MLPPVRPPVLSLLALLALGLLPVSAAAAERDAWPVVGSVGYGRTVLHGTTVETFACTYVGLLERAMPGQDLHLIRLHGSPYETSGVIAGMSGSPVYFDGRLLGALGYGWTFTKEPIAGVAPIENMRAAAEGMDRAPREGRTAAAPPGLAPISTPIWVSGLSVDEARLHEVFGSDVLFAAAGSGAAGPVDPARPYENGSAISVKLISGDLEMDAVGTVTLVEGDRIWAFGHPFYGRGEVDWPIATASILGVLPSVQRSFKFGASGPIVGRLRRDLQPAIVGTIGPGPATIPLRVEVSAPTGARRFSFEAVRDELFSAALLGMANDAALGAIAGDFGRGGAEIEVTVRAEGRTHRFAERGLFTSSPSEASVLPPVIALWTNPFRRILPDSVDVRVRITGETTYLRVVSAEGPATPVRAGATVPIRVHLQRSDGLRITREVAIRVPANARPGRKRLFVGAGRGWWLPGLPEPENLSDYLDRFDRYERNDDLVVALVAAERAGAARGQVLPRLPRAARVVQGATLPEETRWSFRQEEILAGGLYIDMRIGEDEAP